MSKLGTLMASCCRGVQREEASHKLNLKMRLALHLQWQKRLAGLGDDQNNGSFATLLQTAGSRKNQSEFIEDMWLFETREPANWPGVATRAGRRQNVVQGQVRVDG